MKLFIGEKVIARTAKMLGLNIEIHDHEDRTNIWDWLADSGAQIVREFHPERTLRKKDVPRDAWDACTDKAAFQTFRERLLADPDGELTWSSYMFDEKVPWMGVPDKIVEHVYASGAEPICSLGFQPNSYEHCLIRDWDATELSDESIDWRAAASAYEYFFAEIWRYASRNGVRYFSMHNEPEWCGPGAFHLPDDIRAVDSIAEIVCNESHDLYPRYCRVLGLQVAAMAMLARMAADDVVKLLAQKGKAHRIKLAGPTSSVLWQPIWELARPYLDICNFHLYAKTPSAYTGVAREVMRRLDEGQSAAITEFGRIGGGHEPHEFLFNLDASLEVARILLHAMSRSRTDDPAFEFLTFYLFAAPSTHRNYKHLVYGDMNMQDWTGLDKGLNRRGEEWYPSFEELQIRWATPAYAMYRMIAHNSTGLDGNSGPFDILDYGFDRVHDPDVKPIGRLETVVVNQGDRLILNLWNPAADDLGELKVPVTDTLANYKRAVVRLTNISHRDAFVCQQLVSGDIKVNVPARSLVQLLFFKDDLSTATELSIREESNTPGGLDDGLNLHQTTRLRAIAKVRGKYLDLSETNITWASSKPNCVRIDQSGLVQRLRASDGPTTLTATLPNGVTASVQLR